MDHLTQAEATHTIIDRLKRMLTARSYASLEELEDAVDSLIWQDSSPEAPVAEVPTA